MGIKVTVSKPELYPIGPYRLVIQGHELVKDSGKIRIKFVIAAGPYANRVVTRNFNPTVSPKSHLGELLTACGVQMEALQVGQELNLDILNNVPVEADLTHYRTQNGEINSLGNFRRAQAVQYAQPAPAPAPAPQYPPQAQAPQYPPQAAPAPAAPAQAPAYAAPAPQYPPQAAAPQAPQQPASQPAPMGQKINF